MGICGRYQLAQLGDHPEALHCAAGDRWRIGNTETSATKMFP
jgi:hypothetical protein